MEQGWKLESMIVCGVMVKSRILVLLRVERVVAEMVIDQEKSCLPSMNFLLKM